MPAQGSEPDSLRSAGEEVDDRKPGRITCSGGTCSLWCRTAIKDESLRGCGRRRLSRTAGFRPWNREASEQR